MRILLFVLIIIAFAGCKTTNVRISLKNVDKVMSYQIAEADKLGKSDKMLTASPEVKEFIQEMSAIGHATKNAIKAPDKLLEQQTRFWGFGEAEKVEADITPDGLKTNFKGEIAKMEFRSELALNDVDNGWLATIVRNMQDQSWSLWLLGIASTVMTSGAGALVVGSIRKKIRTAREERDVAATENELNKKVAKNAIHYGKDMEVIARSSGDGEVKREHIEELIEKRRTVSMLDQHREGTVNHMVILHGEVKIERK